MKKLKIGKSDIHGKGLFTGEPIRKGDLIAKVHSGIQLDPETVKYMPTQYGRFYNHDEQKFNTTNEIIGNHRYLRALKNIPANTELTANYREHSEMEQPENFGQGKYASFDFDKTIATDEGLAKARQMLRDGYNLFIVSARDKVTPDMVARARKAGIPEENIIATGSDEAKVRKVKQLGVEKHFDDKPEVIAALGLVGEQFKKGGGLNSKKYTRSITGTNKLFTKNNLFKKKSTKRIYDPNAKYYAEGGESGCPDGFEEDPQTGECIPIREKVEDIQEMPSPIVQKPPYYQESFVNPAAYVSGYRGGDPRMYKYGFLDSDQGQIIGGGGFGFPKPGVHLNALGVLPMSADDRQYFKGAYEAGISKDIKNLNLGLGVGTAITGYPGENGFVRDPIKLQPKLNLRYNFKEGGALLTKKVTCKKCGWKWDAADGGNDMTTCHKCGGQGLVHAQIGGASEQKIIFSPMEGGCPEGQYWTGTECKIIPKNTKIVYSEEELAKSNISKKEQQKLYNQYISRVNNHNAYEAAVLKKYGKIGDKDKYYKTFESIPKHGWDPWMSYGSGKLMPPKDGIPYINEQMVPFKQWKKMMDKSSVKPIGFKGNPGGGHFYPIYEKPSNYLLGYNKEEEPIIPTTRTVYIDCPPGSVSNGQKTDITTFDPDSPGNYLRTITTGCDPIKEKEVIVPTVEPVINKQESPLIESMGTQDYPEELKGSDWEWDKKWHSFTTPRLNKHFPLGPLFNGKKKHNFSTPYLHRRKDYEDGGTTDYQLGDEIDEATMKRLKKLGYIFEKIR